jgi:hypothetical protein
MEPGAVASKCDEVGYGSCRWLGAHWPERRPLLTRGLLVPCSSTAASLVSLNQNPTSSPRVSKGLGSEQTRPGPP